MASYLLVQQLGRHPHDKILMHKVAELVAHEVVRQLAGLSVALDTRKFVSENQKSLRTLDSLRGAGDHQCHRSGRSLFDTPLGLS